MIDTPLEYEPDDGERAPGTWIVQGARVRTASSASAVAATAKRQKVIVSGPVWVTPMGPAMYPPVQRMTKPTERPGPRSRRRRRVDGAASTASGAVAVAMRSPNFVTAFLVTT
jgi:hypothetical protein